MAVRGLERRERLQKAGGERLLELKRIGAWTLRWTGSQHEGRDPGSGEDEEKRNVEDKIKESGDVNHC